MDFSAFMLILASTVLVNNFVLVQFLGLCPFMGVSNQLPTAIGMSLATGFVLTLSSILAYLSYAYLLVPLGAEYLRTLTFILMIAVTVQFAEMFIKKASPLLHRVLGIYLPLITSNCAVLGVALLSVKKESSSLLEAAVYGFGAAIGFSLVLILFSALRERINAADVPKPFKGASVAMISAGLMSMAFMGFSGLTVS